MKRIVVVITDKDGNTLMDYERIFSERLANIAINGICARVADTVQRLGGRVYITAEAVSPQVSQETLTNKGL